VTVQELLELGWLAITPAQPSAAICPTGIPVGQIYDSLRSRG